MNRYVGALLAGMALCASPAASQGASCADRTLMVGRLAEKYGETLQGAGLNQSNNMIELFANAKTGTWTILATTPNGMSCMMAAGRAWQGFAIAPVKGSPV